MLKANKLNSIVQINQTDIAHIAGAGIQCANAMAYVLAIGAGLIASSIFVTYKCTIANFTRNGLVKKVKFDYSSSEKL